MATFNLNTPNIPDEADILTQVRQIRSYITNLNNQLRYDLSNIDEDNLTGGELPENAIPRGFRQKVLDLQGNMSVFEQTATHFLARVENAEGAIGSLELTAESLTTNYSTLSGTVASQGTAITQNAQQIALKADETVTDGLNTRLTSAEEKITPNAITATVRSHANYQSDLSAKNRTFVGGTPTGMIAGDLWIDSENGNLLKRYNGSAWAAVQDGAISIAQQQADKIQWLVASGTAASNMELTDRLYTLVTNRVMITAQEQIELAVGNVQVGGRNLLLNSGGQTETTHWAVWSPGAVSTLATWYDSPKKLRMIAVINVVSGTSLYTKPVGDIYAVDENYTLTFVSLGVAPSSVWMSIDESSGTAISFGAPVLVKTLGGGYYQYQATAVVLAVPTNPNLYFSYNTTATSIGITNIKLEKGTMATDWSPTPSDPASGVKTSKVTIDGTGIAMTTGGTFTTTSQNFNIDAAGNVVMKGTVEASAGKIAGFSMSGGMLIDTETNGMNLELDPANGVLDVGMMRITKYGTSDGFDLFYQGDQSGVCRVYSGSKSLNLTSEVGGTERSISIGDGIYLIGNTYFKDSVFGYHADSDSYVPMLNSKNWLDYIYPVGAIYMSSASTSPGTLFGGTWTAITNPPTGAGYWWKRTG